MEWTYLVLFISPLYIYSLLHEYTQFSGSSEYSSQTENNNTSFNIKRKISSKLSMKDYHKDSLTHPPRRLLLNLLL